MVTIQKTIQSALTEAIHQSLDLSVIIPKLLEANFTQESIDKLFTAIVAPGNPKLCDFQFNSTMPILKALQQINSLPENITEASQLTQLIISAIPESYATVFTAELPAKGPFANIKLCDSWIIKIVQELLATHSPVMPSLPAPPVVPKETVVVDFSSPNIAKSMHVGHLRSTIIGDSICRMFEYLGCDVERTNHVGDWGTQFGMLIAHLFEKFPDFLDHKPEISNLVTFYKEAKSRFDEEDEFKERAWQEVVRLQSGDERNMKAWQILCDVSREEFQRIYDQLDIKLNEIGESFYNSRIPGVIEELQDKGIATEDNGAICVFLEGKQFPLIIRKSDGGYGYDSTDMAAIKYRIFERHADRLIYVVDNGQGPHFDMVFAAAEKAGYITDGKPAASFVGFGLVLGDDGKKFRTRSGATVNLQDLLDEAVQKAREQLDQRENDFSDEEKQEIAHAIGIGAVKYADLSNIRTKDYTFSFDRMLNMKGDTAVYLLYSISRICSIARNAENAGHEAKPEAMRIVDPAERALLLQIARFHDALLMAAENLLPNKLCEYAYDLSTKFSQFYNNCKVVSKEENWDESLTQSRLAICEATAKMLKAAMTLLGIQTVERM